MRLLAIAVLVVIGCGPTNPAFCPVEDRAPNPAECPTLWSSARAQCGSSMACSNPDLQCWYPGAGDFLANGCAAPGLMTCGGADGGVGRFACSQ